MSPSPSSGCSVRPHRFRAHLRAACFSIVAPLTVCAADGGPCSLSGSIDMHPQRNAEPGNETRSKCSMCAAILTSAEGKRNRDHSPQHEIHSQITDNSVTLCVCCCRSLFATRSASEREKQKAHTPNILLFANKWTVVVRLFT